MVKRKLDGTVDESSMDKEMMQLCIICDKSGGGALLELNLTAGRLAVQQTKFG